jgi:protein ImuA
MRPAGTGEAPSVVPTGWSVIDAAMGGGLQRGHVHEWLGVGHDESAGAGAALRSLWSPPVTILSHLVRCAAAGMGTPWSMWIGRRVWPLPHLFSDVPLVLDHALLVDPSDLGEGVWAADAALRCHGMVVVSDGSRLDMAGSRRLQLAAEAGGSIGLIARPPAERKSLSAATTRWTVSRVLSDAGPRWLVRLARCKAGQSAWGRQSVEAIVERCHAGVVLVASPESVHGYGAAALAS